MSSQATRTNLSNQFIRQFPVPLDRDFVFSSTQARNNYLTDGATSGIAYTGMIVGDLQTNKAYILNTNRAWQEIGGLDPGHNIVISSANSTSNTVVSLSSSLTGLNNIFATGSISGNSLTISNSSTFLSDINVSGNINVLGTGISFNEATVVLTTLDVANSGDFGNALTVGGTGVSLQGHSHVSSNITDFTEASQDAIATDAGYTGFLRNGSGLAWVYNDSANTLSVGVTGIPVSLITDLDAYIGDTIDTTIMPGTGIGLVYNSESNQLYINIETDQPSLNSITSRNNGTENFTINASNIIATGNLSVGGNLVIQGQTTVVDSTIVNIGDNVIRVNTSGLTYGGLEVYKSGSNPLFTTSYEKLVWNTTNNRWEFSGPEVRSTGNIVGEILQSTALSPNPPLVVASTGLVTNLNSDLLDGKDGSYYSDSSNLTGILNTGVFPTAPEPQVSPSVPITGTFLTGFTIDSIGRISNYSLGTLPISKTGSLGDDRGISSFDGSIFSVNDGYVSINNSGITNDKLFYNSFTIGATQLVLGSSTSNISGISSNSPIILTYCHIDGGSP